MKKRQQLRVVFGTAAFLLWGGIKRNFLLGIMCADVLFISNEVNVYAVAKCLVIAVSCSLRNVALCLLAWHEIVVAVFPCQLARVGHVHMHIFAVLAADECVIVYLSYGRRDSNRGESCAVSECLAANCCNALGNSYFCE